MDDNYPTAADYAQNSADKAHRRLERIEAALIKAGLMEPEPAPPAPMTTSQVFATLKSHYERVFAAEIESGIAMPAFSKKAEG